ncbi:MAG: hypothetical protein AMXMBFR12_07390 [Candidatus Babeliales bacterium]
MRDIIELNKEAEKYNLDCLAFLDFVGENIFNHLQIPQIKKKIAILKTTTNLKTTLDVLEKAVTQVPIDPKYYLRFSGE